MEKPKIKLRMEDIQVESFVTSDSNKFATITAYGGWSPNDQAWTETLCNNDCGGGTGLSVPLGGGTNQPGGCTGDPLCQSNTACPDVSCADGGWCGTTDALTCGTLSI